MSLMDKDMEEEERKEGSVNIFALLFIIAFCWLDDDYSHTNFALSKFLNPKRKRNNDRSGLIPFVRRLSFIACLFLSSSFLRVYIPCFRVELYLPTQRRKLLFPASLVRLAPLAPSSRIG